MGIKRVIRAAVLTALGAWSSGAFADDSEIHPEYKIARWLEDYTYLADPAKRTGWFDPIKFVPLSSDNQNYLSFGGQIREEPVYFDAALFGLRGNREDSYLFDRIYLHGDLHLGSVFRLFVELGDAQALGKNKPLAAIDADRLDGQLGFADIKLPFAGGDFTLRVGRQEIFFDATQRLVAVREGPNVRQAFDGVRAIWASKALTVTAFLTSPVSYRNVRAFDDRTDHGTGFDGLRAKFSELKLLPGEINAYWYLYSRDGVRLADSTGDERRNVFGLRYAARVAGFDWDIEPVYQTGHLGSSAVRAWAVGSTAGYTLADALWRPRVGVQFDVASGDRKAGDGNLETFNPLFPKGAYFSEAALTGFSNLINADLSLGLKPTRDDALQFVAGLVWKESIRDAAYAQPLIPIPGSGAQASPFLGYQFQILGSHEFNRHFSIEMELVRFQVSNSLEGIGAQNSNYAKFEFNFLF